MDPPHIWIEGKCIHNGYYSIVLYCIVLYIINIVQLLMKTTFKLMKYVISISKIRHFENDLFFIS